jgi:hypothetical protein
MIGHEEFNVVYTKDYPSLGIHFEVIYRHSGYDVAVYRDAHIYDFATVGADTMQEAQWAIDNYADKVREEEGLL